MTHIQVVVHEKCTNCCTHCFYDQKSIPVSSIHTNIAKCLEHVDEFNSYDVVNLIGGELCFPYYDSYKNELISLINKITKPKIIGTNFLNLQFLCDILNSCDVLAVGTSIDFGSRFRNNSFNVFNNNVDYVLSKYKGLKLFCNMVLTRTNVKQFNYDTFSKYDALFYSILEKSNNNKEFYEKEKLSFDECVNFFKSVGVNERWYVTHDCTAYYQNTNILPRDKAPCGHFQHLYVDGKCILCALK